MWESLGTVRDLGRLQEIAGVLIRYGFGDMVRRIGMSAALERTGRMLHWDDPEAMAHMAPPERVRCALQDLGPTFVKLGQVMATRVDLLTPEWTTELGKLQNAVPALPFAQVRPQLVEDLGADPEAVFERLEEAPLAAASLAQTHRAWLADGSAVVLKVRRPGIRDTVEADLRLMARLAEIVEERAPDLRRAQLAATGAGIVLKMVLEDGFFHADPHPGNIFYLPDGRIGVIDFGMVGRVSEQRRFQIVQLLHGLVERESAPVADVLMEWGEGGGEVDEARLQADVGAFVDQYRGVPLKDLHMGLMLTDVTTILRDNGLSLPPDLALMIKAFLTLEGMGRQLDPDFDMAGAARPFLQRVVLQRYSPRTLLKRGRRTALDAMELVGDLPRELRRLLRTARRGRLHMQVEVTSLKAFGEQVDRAANRLTMGVITAALVVGSSIVMNSAGGGVSSRWLLALGVLGFVGAGLIGLWILLSIWRSGRR